MNTSTFEGIFNMSAVSIIVPIYNAGAQLRRCVDSILTQEFQDFELLLMDDGSTDDSAQIIDEYAQKDARVHAVHKANSGVSDTRNQAMRLAKGTYIQFVDADDWLSRDATKLMVRAIEESGADMVITDFYRVIGTRLSRKGDIDEEGAITRREYADDMLEDPADFYYGVVWNKLYKRSILEEHHLEMDVTLNWCEDFIFNMEYVLHCRTIQVLKAPVYYYVRTHGSLVAQNSGLAATVRMKINVIQYYSAFYRSIYGAEEYATRRPEIYGFLIDFARDGNVAPLAPGTKKLGEENVQAVTDPALGTNILTAQYYERKLLEYCLKPIALQNDIRITDAAVLLYLVKICRPVSAELMADLTGLSKSSVSSSLQRLRGKKLVETVKPLKSSKKEKRDKADAVARFDRKSDTLTLSVKADDTSEGKDKDNRDRKKKAEKKLRKVTLYAPTAPEGVVRQMNQVLQDFDRIRLDGFSVAEREEYLTLRVRSAERIREFFAGMEKSELPAMEEQNQ